jgi:hypothetical protein
MMKQWMLVGLLLAWPSFRHYRPVTFEVRDAESGAAIPNCKIEVTFPHYMELFAPRSTSGPTGLTGSVKLTVAETKTRTLMISTSAEGYLFEQLSYSGGEFFQYVGNAHFVMPLYKQPAPVIELVLPSGFRGALKVRMKRTDELVQGQPGQRSFTFMVPASGLLEIRATRQLRHMLVRWAARYAEGTRIRSLADSGGPISDHDIALRRIPSPGELFVVGTLRDEQRIDEIVNPSHFEENCRVRTFSAEAYKKLKLGSAP